MTIRVFWDIAQYKSVIIYPNFGGACCLLIQDIWRSVLSTVRSIPENFKLQYQVCLQSLLKHPKKCKTHIFLGIIYFRNYDLKTRKKIKQRNIFSVFPLCEYRNDTKLIMFHISTTYAKYSLSEGKSKQSHYRPGQTLRVPGFRGSQISRQKVHEGGKAVSPTHRPSLPPSKYSWLYINYQLDALIIIYS